MTSSDWSSLMSVRAEFDEPAAVLPMVRHRGSQSRELDPRTVRFAEALAVSPSWARIDEARRRLAA